MTDISQPPTQRRRFPRRNLDELLHDARNAEQQALTRFERKNAAVQKYEGLQRLRNRKLDTRRKIIAGALALEHMKHDPKFAQAFHALLDRFVTKLPERVLFGLPISPGKEPDPPS